MMVPDFARICELILTSCGFSEAQKLAVKIATSYRLFAELLSMKKQYDFGEYLESLITYFLLLKKKIFHKRKKIPNIFFIYLKIKD